MWLRWSTHLIDSIHTITRVYSHLVCTWLSKFGMATTRDAIASGHAAAAACLAAAQEELGALWALGLWRFFFGISTSGRLNYKLILYDLLAHLLPYLRSGRGGDRSTASAPVSNSGEPLPCKLAAAIGDRSLISVIIPAYNEGAAICDTIAAALEDPNVEVIVADGGSKDETMAMAAAAGAVVIPAPSGRAACQNAGAAEARGNLLLFLHGDTILPAGYGACMRCALRQEECSVAAFTLRLQPRLPGIRAVEWGANRRSRTLQLPYGDQALMMRREVRRSPLAGSSNACSSNACSSARRSDTDAPATCRNPPSSLSHPRCCRRLRSSTRSAASRSSLSSRTSIWWTPPAHVARSREPPRPYPTTCLGCRLQAPGRGRHAPDLQPNPHPSASTSPNTPITPRVFHLGASWRRQVVTLPESVLSSARRWELNGVVGNTVRNQLVLIGRKLGVSNERIARWYYGSSGKKTY